MRFTDRTQRLFVPKFYHDRRDKNFLKGLIYVGEKAEIDEKYFQEAKEEILGRKLYEYQINRNNKRPTTINPKDIDRPFPELFYDTIGFTVRGFTFQFKNTSSGLAPILNPVNNLINTSTNTEEAINGFTEELFFSSKKRLMKK